LIDDWYATRSLGDGITLIWERQIKPYYRANMWHVRGRDRSVLIDTGFGLVSLVESVPELREAGLLALGTHSHCDHVGGHHEFGCRAIHVDEAGILAAPTRDNTVATPYVVDDMFEGATPAWFDARTYAVKAAPATQVLVHGDVIDLGDRALEVIHLPGHSPGSVAFWDARNGVLFSGDVVHDGPVGIGTLSLYHTDHDVFLASVEGLRDWPVEVVHAGHFDSFGRTRFRAIIDGYIASRRVPGCPTIAPQAHAQDAK
jgi:glyoxylase-like metal-dependent hydrolase (beta-lactamase superfamily II)